MDKLTYSSTKAQLKPGRYTVGCIVDDELHLNPIHGILHMKPSFPYLDKSDKKLKNAEKDQEKKQNGMENTAGKLYSQSNLFHVYLFHVIYYYVCNRIWRGRG
jgi:hypothetical protein